MSPERQSVWMRGWAILFAYAVVGFAIYFNALDNPFHYDDIHDIVKNPYIQYIGNLPRLFVDPIYASGEEYFTHTYRPLTYASYYLNYAVGRLNPTGYHLVNLGLHVGVAFLLYLMTALFSGSSGLGVLTGMIFLIHPFNSEGMNYITARSSLMATFFYVLSVYAYLRACPPLFRETDDISHKRVWWLGVSFFSFVLAMLSKEIAVTLPAILYLYEITFRRKKGRGLLSISSLGKPLFFVVVVVLPYLLLRTVFYGTPLAEKQARDMVTQLFTSPIVLTKMMQLIMAPINLTIEHDIPVMHTIWAWPVIGALALILGLIVVTVMGIVRRGQTLRLVSFGVAWFFVTQLPTVIIPLTALLQENRGYLSAVGLFLAVVPGIAYLFSKYTEHICWVRRIQWGGVVMILLLFCGMTLQRNVVWNSDRTLWRDAVQKSPGSARAHAFLGVVYRDEGHPGLALSEFQQSISLRPDDAVVFVNLSKLYYDTGQLSLAEKALLDALRFSPNLAEAHFNLGLVYKQQNRQDLAIQEFLRVIENNRSSVEGYVVLGEEYGAQNRSDLALYYFRKALSIDPGDALSRLNVASLLERQGDRRQAIEEYKQVMEQDPSRPENRFAIEKAREQLKRLKETS